MQIETNVLLATGKQPQAIIKHKNELPLYFAINGYKKGFLKDFDVFEELNAYWSILSMEKQDAIYNTYKEIKDVLDSTLTVAYLNQNLTKLVTKLIDLQYYPDVRNWVVNNPNIHIPDGFTEDYVHNPDINTSRDKTYIRSDYPSLVALALTLRCMVPVWGEYIEITKGYSGNLFKEYNAFHLLKDSDILTIAPMEKLHIYIKNIIEADKEMPGKILSGISSEDTPYWLLARICVHILSVGDIRGINTKVNLVTSVFKEAKQKISGKDGSPEKMIRIKDKRSSDDDEDKTSSLERYKVRFSISYGDIVELEYSMQNIRAIAQRLAPTLDEATIERSLRTCKALENQPIQPCQISLLKWVFKPMISPKGIMYLPKRTIVDMLGALEAVLWARGHKYLSLFAAAVSVDVEDGFVVSPMDSKMQIEPEIKEEIERLYPFTKNMNDRRTGPRDENLAILSINNLIEQLAGVTWRTSCDEAMLLEVTGNTSKRLPIRPDIRTLLANLVIDLGKENRV